MNKTQHPSHFKSESKLIEPFEQLKESIIPENLNQGENLNTDGEIKFNISQFLEEIINNQFIKSTTNDSNKINLLSDEEAKELESKEDGMWATVDEYVKATGLKKWTIYRKIKNNELIAKKASNIYNKFNKETLYIWVRNKKIISIIEIDKKIKNQKLSIKIEISSDEAEKIQEEIKKIQPKKGKIKKDKHNNLIIQGKIQIEDLLPLIKKTV